MKSIKPEPYYPDAITAYAGLRKALRCGARSACAATVDGYTLVLGVDESLKVYFKSRQMSDSEIAALLEF